MQKTVIIDCFPANAPYYRNDYAVVAVDVIRATTTAITAVALGRDCYPVSSLEAAVLLASQLMEPLFVGELGGEQIPGFDINNSPVQVALRRDVHRPMVLLSTSGTKLIWASKGNNDVYVACLRNYTAMAQYLTTAHSKIAILGAGTRNEFREEDQLCCAWIASYLVDAGYEPQNDFTRDLISYWKGASIDKIRESNSSQYLIRSKQEYDLDFIVTHIDDLTDVYLFEEGQIMRCII